MTKSQADLGLLGLNSASITAVCLQSESKAASHIPTAHQT